MGKPFKCDLTKEGNNNVKSAVLGHVLHKRISNLNNEVQMFFNIIVHNVKRLELMFRTQATTHILALASSLIL